MSTMKRLALFFLVVTIAVSILVMIAKLSVRAPSMVKEGKIKDIEYHIWRNSDELSDIGQMEYNMPQADYFLNRPSVTVLRFEEGEAIAFVGIIDDVEIDGRYRVVYHEQYEYCSGNLYWSGNYYVADSIEEID